MFRAVVAAYVALIVAFSTMANAQAYNQWEHHFPKTNFSRSAIDLSQVVTYGAPNSIPPIDDPVFARAGLLGDIGALEPVVSIDINGDKRAYPIRVLLFHEIVNDVVGGVPVVVTYCAFCNSAIVFDRRVKGAVLEFANTGTYRHYGMVMYDKQTQSWWQQFVGQAVVGDRLGQELKPLPARTESLEKFRTRLPEGLVLVPNATGAYPYGTTNYSGYADPVSPQLAAQRYPYDIPKGINPMARVVIVGDVAWAVDMVRAAGRIETDEYVLTWEPGQNSVYHGRTISEGLDVGNILVQRKSAGALEDVRYEVSFAFVFAAFVPDGTWHR